MQETCAILSLLYMDHILERFRGTIFRAKIRMGATDFFQACSIRFFGTRIRVDWLSYEPCFVWRFCVIGCRKIFRVQIWYEKHRFFAGSFDFGTNFKKKGIARECDVFAIVT